MVPERLINIQRGFSTSRGLPATIRLDMSAAEDKSACRISVLLRNGTPYAGSSTHVRFSRPAWKIPSSPPSVTDCSGTFSTASLSSSARASIAPDRYGPQSSRRPSLSIQALGTIRVLIRRFSPNRQNSGIALKPPAIHLRFDAGAVEYGEFLPSHLREPVR